MALVTLPHEKKQQIMIIILVVVILIVTIVLYFGFFRSRFSRQVVPVSLEGEPTGIASEAIETEGTTNGFIQEEFDINFPFLKDPRFQELKKYGVWPVKLEDIGETGRTNPFLPLTISGGATEEELEGETEEEVEEGAEEEISEEGLTDGEIEELLEELLEGGAEEDLEEEPEAEE